MPVFPTATTITATSVNSSHVFPISDGTARQEISPAQSVRAAILLTSTVTPVAADTTVFNDVSGSVIGSATIAAIVAAGMLQPAASSGAGTDLTIQASSAGSGNSNGGNLILIPGDNSGSGTDGVVVIRQPGGVAGTDQVEISHDGTQTVITSRDGPIVLRGSGGEPVVFRRASDNAYLGKIDNAEGIFFQTIIDLGSIKLRSGVLGLAHQGVGFSGTVSTSPRNFSLTSNQNNYNLGGPGLYYRGTSDASRTITGIAISQVDGQMAEIWNVGSNNIVLAHESASSTASNRFLTNTGADITLAANEMALLRYDSTSSRWRISKV